MSAGKITTFTFGKSSFLEELTGGDGYINLASDASVVEFSLDTARLPAIDTTDVDGVLLDDGDRKVEKTGTGEYTITLSGKFRRIRAIIPAMNFGSGAAHAIWACNLGNTVNPDTDVDTQVFKIGTMNSSGSLTNVNFACGIYLIFCVQS